MLGPLHQSGRRDGDSAARFSAFPHPSHLQHQPSQAATHHQGDHSNDRLPEAGITGLENHRLPDAEQLQSQMEDSAGVDGVIDDPTSGDQVHPQETAAQAGAFVLQEGDRQLEIHQPGGFDRLKG